MRAHALVYNEDVENPKALNAAASMTSSKGRRSMA